MSNYHWLITIKLSDGALAIASLTGSSPDPGDMVELEDGTLATVVTKSIFSDYDQEYQAATAIVPPRKVACWYERKEVKEPANAPA
jgi:hypothetical protein